jgi:hypothetical protein
MHPKRLRFFFPLGEGFVCLFVFGDRGSMNWQSLTCHFIEAKGDDIFLFFFIYW